MRHVRKEWTLEQAQAAQKRFVARGGRPVGDPHSPLSQWQAMHDLDEEEARFKNGEKYALAMALSICCTHALQPPPWAATAYNQGFHAVHTFRTDSWETIFGPAKRWKGRQLKALRKRFENSIVVQVRQLITATYIATVCLCLTQCAQQSQASLWCARQNEQAISLDLQILGCTTLIQSPNESPDSVATALNNRSFAYQRKGEPHRAIQDLDQAIRLKPDFALAFHGRGVAYLSEGDYNRAFQDSDNAIRLKPDFAEAFVTRGAVYARRREYDPALQDFDRAIRLKPDLALAFYDRGTVYSARGEFDRAIEEFYKAIRLKPDFAAPFYDRGVAYAKKGDYARAFQDFDQAIRLKPDYAEALDNRGFAYSRQGEYDRAIGDFDEAIRLKPDFALAFYNRGVTYASKGDYARAFQDFDNAVRLKPDFAEAFNNRCFAGALTNKALEAALSDCNESLRLAPQSAAALGSRGLVYFRMAHYAQAIADCTASLDRDPKSADALYVRGLARQRAGDPRRGTADIAAAQALDPKIIQTYAKLPGMAGAPR